MRIDQVWPAVQHHVAEERQEVSSKSTIDQMAAAITGGNDISLRSANILENVREYWLKNYAGSEPSPESSQYGCFTFVREGFTFVQGGLDTQIWQKFH